MKNTKKLILAGLMLAVSACSCGQRDAHIERMRASYCESINYEDEDNCSYVPVIRTDDHPCNALDDDWTNPALIAKCNAQLAIDAQGAATDCESMRDVNDQLICVDETDRSR